MQILEEASEENGYTLFNLYAHIGSPSPYLVTLQVDGVPIQMEIDTGSSLSLISESTFRRLWPNRTLEDSLANLTMYSGAQLQVLGTVDVQVCQANARPVNLSLAVVGADGPSLLGRDLIKSLQLDWARICRLDAKPAEAVLQRHSKVFQEELGLLQGYQASIYVDPTARPQFFRPRPVPYSMRSLIEQELERLVQSGVLKPVQFADWAAPIVPVLKGDKKSVRICGDFSVTVNQVSRLDSYPLPKPEDLFARLAGGKTFSILDLSQAYLQIELDKDSRKFVAINTHKGLFQFTRLPYGVSSAPGIFQRTMEALLQDIPAVMVYIDDILITGKSEEEHLETLQRVLVRLEESGLKLKRSKCLLMPPSVTYLGHKIDKDGIHPLAEKVRAVQKAPEPKNVTELKAYLGLLSYYGRFMPNLAHMIAPLYHLLCASTHWQWTSQEQNAFEASKELLAAPRVLAHYDPQLPLVLACDASPYGLGAMLAHRYPDGTEKPVAYASRTLSAAEKNYSQIEKEGLACVFGVKRFHLYLYGRSFTLATDHKPLLSLFGVKKPVPPQASGQIQQWALTLSMYDYTLIHKKSAEHGNADALSRVPLPDSISSTPIPAKTVLLLEQMNEMPVTAEHIKTWTLFFTYLVYVRLHLDSQEVSRTW